MGWLISGYVIMREYKWDNGEVYNKFNRVKWYRWFAGEQNKNEKMPIHKNITEKWMKLDIL